jgi:perosamine synthetase
MDHPEPISIAHPFFDEAEQRAATEALKSGWVSMGSRCKEFEEAVAELVGVRHARAVNSGTSAIHLALIASGIGPGDQVAVPAFTCAAMLHPIEQVGARPILVDISLESYAMAIDRLSEVLASNVKAVMVAHLFGLAAPMDQLSSLVGSFEDVALIEDAALGLGAQIGKQYAGSFADVACLSFHPRKIITTGEGGMVLTDSDAVARRVGELRNYGASVSAWDRHQRELFTLPTYETVGYNYKLSDVLAGIGIEQLRKLAGMIELRQQIASHYRSSLGELQWLRLPKSYPGSTHVYQSFVCLLDGGDIGVDVGVGDNRDRLFRHLLQRGVESVQGAQAMATITYYQRKYDWRPRNYPNALLADRASLALPMHPGLSESEQGRVIDAVRSFRPSVSIHS